MAQELACSINGAKMTRTVPEKCTFFTATGTRAPSTPTGVRSISACEGRERLVALMGSGERGVG